MRMIIAAAALVLVGILAGSISDRAAAATDYPWCAIYGDSHGGINCGFTSLAQCRAAISGNGGYCQYNPYLPRPRR